MTLISAIVHDQSLQLIALLALVAGLADWAVAVVRALRDRVFSLQLVAEYLTGHVILRFAPIVLLAFIGAALSSVMAASSESFPPELSILAGTVTVAAWAGLLAYLGETVASLKATSEGHVHDDRDEF